MHITNDVYRVFLSFFNYPYISEEIIKNIKGPVLLHISDTPADTYNYIFRIINMLKPQFIIHTGDMADNIKLGIYKNRIDCYRKEIARLIEGLEKNEFSEIYYALGNHDDHEAVSQLTKRGTILEDGLLTINDLSIRASHYYKEYSKKSDFNLYGHSPEYGHFKKENTICLNGLLNINIIDLSSKNVFHLDYPIGTNRSRGMELKKTGI